MFAEGIESFHIPGSRHLRRVPQCLGSSRTSVSSFHTVGTTSEEPTVPVLWLRRIIKMKSTAVDVDKNNTQPTTWIRQLHSVRCTAYPTPCESPWQQTRVSTARSPPFWGNPRSVIMCSWPLPVYLRLPGTTFRAVNHAGSTVYESNMYSNGLAQKKICHVQHDLRSFDSKIFSVDHRATFFLPKMFAGNVALTGL